VDVGTIIRELDPATGQLHGVDAAGFGHLPFLTDGKLAWASAPRAAKPRLASADGTFQIGLPGEPSIVAPGPGSGRITAVVNVGDPNTGIRDERIVIINVAERTATQLPTKRFHFGGVWTDDTTLVASASVLIEPTPNDPENAEVENRVLTWTVDADGSNPKAVAGLVRGPTLLGSPYPARVAGGSGWIAVETGDFDHPTVDVHKRGSNDPPRIVALEQAGYVTALSISGTTLVVLQSAKVTFIALATGEMTPADLGGSTQTTWVGG
jgi:hypothetical protein